MVNGHSTFCLSPDILCVQTPRNRRVGGAFDDGATVGEESHLVGLAPELQHELTVLHLAVGRKSAGDLVEVDGTLAFVDLDRIAAAHRNMRAACAGEMHEVTLPASAAAIARTSGGDF